MPSDSESMTEQASPSQSHNPIRPNVNYQELVETLNAAVAVLDQRGKVLFANPRFASVWDDSLIAGKSISDLFQPPEAASILEALRSKAGLHSDLACQVKGQKRWLHVHLNRLPSSQESDPQFSLHLFDFTEEKTTHEKLVESETRYRLISSSTADFMFVKQANAGDSLTMQWVTGAFERITGYTLEEFVSQGGLQGHIHPDDRLIYQRSLQQLHNNQSTVSELRIVRRDGQVIWVRLHSQPIWDFATNSLVAVNGAVQDITAQKETERVLEERVQQRTAEIEAIRRRLELATRAAGIGIWDWNVKTGALLWSDQMLKLYGITREQFDGTFNVWVNRLHPDEAPVQQKRLETAMQEQGEYDAEFRVVWPDGSEHIMKSNAITLYDLNGEPERMIGVNYDITLAKKAEEVLRQSEQTLRHANYELERAIRMKDEFLSSMSHELRTPLTGILGLSEALQYQSYGPVNDQQLRALANIESSGRNLLGMINDILDVSKMEAGKLELQVEPCSLAEVCQASLQLVKGMTQKKRQNVSFMINPVMIRMHADSRRLKQILAGLLNNASKFTAENGSLGLEVQGDAEAQCVRLTVWDNGIGIKPEDMNMLFVPFVQLDGSLARQQSGTGLGLPLVQRLIELHGGSIQVESTPGKGSRFTVVLPWVPGNDPRQHPEMVEPLVLTRPILTIEENTAETGYLARLLNILGANSVIQGHRQAVIQQAVELQPGLVVLDPGASSDAGWKILADLKANPATQKIPVIVTAPQEDRRRAIEAGAAGFCNKPFKLSDLRYELEQVISPSTRLTASLGAETQKIAPIVMVVDENELNVESLIDYLESRMYTLVWVQNGWDFLDRAPQVRPDIILIDIQMPGLDGLEAIKRIRAHGDTRLASVPIIAVTTLDLPGGRERCLLAGANEYLSKPLRLKEVASLIAELLRKRRPVL